MKKSIIIFLLFSLFTGCGLDQENNKNAAIKLANTIHSINSQSSTFSDETAQKFSSYASQITEFVKKSDDEIKSGKINSQEQIDEITKKYEEYVEGLEKIASENDIKIESSSQENS